MKNNLRMQHGQVVVSVNVMRMRTDRLTESALCFTNQSGIEFPEHIPISIGCHQLVFRLGQ